MTIAAGLTVTPSAPAHGAVVTAVYAVTGNNPILPQSVTVSGDANVGGTDFAVSTTITLPGDPAEPVTYAVPTCPGLTFAVSPSDPTGATFTATVP
jgi:hypothetical protein